MSDPLLDELPILRELEADLRAAFGGADSRRRLPRSRPRWSLAAATAALAAIAAVFVFALQGGGVTPTIASAVLRRTADVAQRQPSPFPQDDQFYYLRSVGTYWRAVGAEPSTLAGGRVPLQVRLRVEQQLWFSAGRTGLTRSRVLSLHFASSAARRAWERDGRPSYSTSPQRIAALGANRYLLGDLELSRRQVLTFTTDPPRLYGRLYAAAGGSAYEVFVEIGDQLRNRPTPAPLRAALYRALALVPGIRLVGATTDSISRHGQAVAFTDHGVEDELIFDPKTATMLEERTIAAARNPLRLAPGTTISSTTYIQRAITDKIAAP